MTSIGFDKPLYILPFDHREEAVAAIANPYREFVNIFEEKLVQPHEKTVAAATKADHVR